MNIEIMKRAVEAAGNGEPFALVTVLETEGSAPGTPGQKMIVFPDGKSEGTVGGGALEETARAEAVTRIASGRSGLLTCDMDPGSVSPDRIGAVCGGRAVLVIEVAASPVHILLLGAGHVGFAFARLSRQLGWSLTVVDRRSDLMTRDRFPGAGTLHEKAPDAFSLEADLVPFTHVIIMTHDHTLDRAILAAIASRDFMGYVGMIGSLNKWMDVRRDLEGRGCDPAWLDRVHCPIGLPIGSRTPDEIAIAIAAEIIQATRRPKSAGHEEGIIS
jgi:xanthine dehydrogenase accessory factor